MLKGIALATAVSLAIAVPARAENVAASANPAFKAEVVEVQSHRNPAGVILGDTVGGAVAGAAVGGGVVLWKRYVDNSGWGDWGRTIAIGAAIGAGVGLLFGVVDAASSADRAPNYPLADVKDRGFSSPAGQYTSRF
jgi:hypothetical protein